MLKWIEACKSQSPTESLIQVAYEEYDNTADRVIVCSLAQVCDTYNLVTQEEVAEKMFAPLTWGEYDGRDYIEVLKLLYIDKIRWMHKNLYQDLREGE